MPTLDSMDFDTTRLHLQSEVEHACAWSSEAGLVVELALELAPPEFPAPLQDVQALTKSFRSLVAHHGAGLVELSVLLLDGCPALRTIVKTVLDQQTGWGRSYLGTLRIPFRDFSYLLKVECRERGVTGWRETALVHQFLDSGRIRFKIEDTGAPPEPGKVLGPADMEGWLVDEADPTPPHLAANIAEDGTHDAAFPDHPLSQVRAFLDRVQPSIRIAEEVKTTCPLWAPPRVQPWWRWW